MVLDLRFYVSHRALVTVDGSDLDIFWAALGPEFLDAWRNRQPPAPPSPRQGLTESQRAQIRRRRALGEGCVQLARLFGVDHSTISKLTRDLRPPKA